jgi:hypothetical protein
VFMVMNKYIRVLLCIALLPLHAADNKKGAIETCSIVYEDAHSVMEERQKGTPISEAMKTADIISPNFGDTISSIVISAYSKPHHQRIGSKIQAADDFANEYAVKCFKQYKWLWRGK